MAGESAYRVAIDAVGSMHEILSGRAAMRGFHGNVSLGVMPDSASTAAMIGASAGPHAAADRQTDRSVPDARRGTQHA